MGKHKYILKEQNLLIYSKKEYGNNGCKICILDAFWKKEMQADI